MHPDTHLLLHHQRSAELRQRAMDFDLAPADPRASLRARLGWLLVESGLRIMPRSPDRSSAVPGTA
ncbi:hypothetical protein ABZ826_22540 [Streptomyces sp. NPDC047515]|uniref:hypothetical protein n=1 Tax=Streptomyces sp. NPDC047515 TaxID=3155380 RepID=UPI0033D00C21